MNAAKVLIVSVSENAASFTRGNTCYFSQLWLHFSVLIGSITVLVLLGGMYGLKSLTGPKIMTFTYQYKPHQSHLNLSELGLN